MFIIGEYIYSGEQAAITSGIILGVMVPILLIFIAVWLWYIHEKKHNEPVTTTWRYERKEPDLTDDSTTNFLRGSKPYASDSSDSGNGSRYGNRPNGRSNGKPWFRRGYDKVYRTHEPLPGKPNIEFEDKVWDLDLDDTLSSKAESDSTTTASKVQTDI